MTPDLVYEVPIQRHNLSPTVVLRFLGSREHNSAFVILV